MTPRTFSLAAEASVALQGGEAVVLHLHTGRFFTVNRSGTPLLDALRRPGGATRDDLAAVLVARYALPTELAQRDVDGWLARLEAAGLLAASPTESGA